MGALLSGLEFIAGLVVVLLTLTDVFATILVPRRLALGLNVGRWLRRTLTPAWTRAARRAGRERTQNLLSGFAAFLLVAAFTTWMLLLLLGFSLMQHALAADFSPALQAFPEVLFEVGTSMLTLGVSGHTVRGAARAVVVFSGLAGLGVVTLNLTFILQIQSGLKDRDAQVLTLAARAGRPPSGLGLIETMAELGLSDRLGDLFESWEGWTARVLHTHTAHPVLALFRSGGPDDDWITALGAVLDGAAAITALTRDGPKGQATILHQIGSRASTSLCGLFDLPPEPPPPLTHAQAQDARRRLTRAGYALDPAATSISTLQQLRAGYAGHIAALARHLGVPEPQWSPATT